MEPLRVGIIGYGEIAQIMHLPYLAELCDLSPTVVNATGERYGVHNRYSDYHDLVAQSDLDIIAILTLDHFDVARAAIDAGKHVFVEKPLCFSVLFSDLTHDWRITAVLDYTQGRRCVFEVGSWPKYPWFHEHIVAFGRDEIVTVAFSPPFVKNAPTTIQIERSDVGHYVKSNVVISHEEAFKREWVHLADCIATGRTPKTDGAGADAVQDIELAVEIVRAVPNLVSHPTPALA
jgi:predicted dehydrogenase